MILLELKMHLKVLNLKSNNFLKLKKLTKKSLIKIKYFKTSSAMRNEAFELKLFY